MKYLTTYAEASNVACHVSGEYYYRVALPKYSIDFHRLHLKLLVRIEKTSGERGKQET